MKLAVADGYGGFGLAWWQAAISFVLLLALIKVQGRRLPLSKAHWIFYAVCGAFGTAIPHSISFHVAPHLPAGVMAVILSLTPVFTYALALPFRSEAFSPRRILGTLAGVIAIIVLVSPAADLTTKQAFWVVVALAPPACYAVENLYIDLRSPGGLDPISALCGMSLAALIMLTPIVLARDEFVGMFPPWSTAQWALVGMTLLHIFAYATLIFLINKAGPVFAAQTGYLVTFSGVALGMLILHESHAEGFWIALVLLTLGLALVTPRAQKDGAKSEESAL